MLLTANFWLFYILLGIGYMLIVVNTDAFKLNAKRVEEEAKFNSKSEKFLTFFIAYLVIVLLWLPILISGTL